MLLLQQYNFAILICKVLSRNLLKSVPISLWTSHLKLKLTKRDLLGENMFHIVEVILQICQIYRTVSGEGKTTPNNWKFTHMRKPRCALHWRQWRVSCLPSNLLSLRIFGLGSKCFSRKLEKCHLRAQFITWWYF